MTRLVQIALLLCLACMLAPSGVTLAEGLARQRLKIAGRIEDGSIVAEKVRHRDPRRDPGHGSIEGEASDVVRADRTLRIGPLIVEWDDATRFSGVDVAALGSGAALEVSGKLIAPGRLRAEVVEVGAVDHGEIKLLGQVSTERRSADGTLVLQVLGVDVLVPAQAEPGPLTLIRDPSEKRPDASFVFDVLGRPLTVTGSIESRLRFEGQQELGEEDDDVLRADSETKLELLYRAGERAWLFLEGKAVHEADLAREGGDREKLSALERGQSWLFWSPWSESGIGLQIGRQTFRDRREWWWDQDLDAVRVSWERFPFAIEAGVARELFASSTVGSGIESEEQGIVRLIAHASWSPAPSQNLDLFALRQWDRSARPSVGDLVADDREDESDADLLWLGARSSGDVDLGRFGDLAYWCDLALVQGRETTYSFRAAGERSRVRRREARNVLGFGTDAGLVLATPLPGRPSFTLGYASGSGDGGDGKDDAFRQTGLQRNKDRFRGVNRFRFYGELLDPELSNLHVATAAVGFPILHESSVELVWHHYRQQHASDSVRGARLDAEPEGLRRNLGQEWDLVVGLQEWDHVEVEIVGAALRAGSAFGDREGKWAFGGFLQVEYRF